MSKVSDVLRAKLGDEEFNRLRTQYNQTVAKKNVLGLQRRKLSKTKKDVEDGSRLTLEKQPISMYIGGRKWVESPVQTKIDTMEKLEEALKGVREMELAEALLIKHKLSSKRYTNEEDPATTFRNMYFRTYVQQKPEKSAEARKRYYQKNDEVQRQRMATYRARIKEEKRVMAEKAKEIAEKLVRD